MMPYRVHLDDWDACPDGCFCERCVKPASKEAILAKQGAG